MSETPQDQEPQRDTENQEVQKKATELMHIFGAVGMLAIFIRVTDEGWETHHVGIAVDEPTGHVVKEISDMVDIAFFGEPDEAVEH